METIESWTTKESVDETMIEEWSEQGKAFWNLAASSSSIYESEVKEMEVQKIEKVPDTSKYAANMYVKVGGDADPVFVKVSKSSETATMSLEGMIESGSAFKNLSSLAVQESVINRADGIASRLQNENVLQCVKGLLRLWNLALVFRRLLAEVVQSIVVCLQAQ